MAGTRQAAPVIDRSGRSVRSAPALARHEVGQMNTPFKAQTLQDLVALVQGQLDVVCALVTRVTGEQQFVLAHAGRVVADWDAGPTTLDYSICQHCVAMNFPLVIEDAFSHPLLRGNRAVSDLGVAAYIGAPVHLGNGRTVGAICALDFHRRHWTDDDLRLMTDCAHIADRLVEADPMGARGAAHGFAHATTKLRN